MGIAQKSDPAVSELPLRSPVGELLDPPFGGTSRLFKPSDIKLLARHLSRGTYFRELHPPPPRPTENICAAAHSPQPPSPSHTKPGGAPSPPHAGVPCPPDDAPSHRPRE